MRCKMSRLLACALMPFLPALAGALESPGHHVLIVPQCLASAAGVDLKPIATWDRMLLLDAGDATVNQLVSARNANHAAMLSCGGFRDVTRAYKSTVINPKAFLEKYATTSKVRAEPLPPLQYPGEVKQLLDAINPQNMWTLLTTLTEFRDRYANSGTGVQAAEWIQGQVLAMSAGRQDVSVYTIPTGGYKQPSVILKIGNSNGPGVVVSGHMDTVSGWGIFHMPGADDDGSGSVTVLEAARTVLASGMHFEKPIYFMWYAAEEEGLVGSDNVVGAFQDRHIPVDIALHFDMTGFESKNDPTMWLLADYTDPKVTNWLSTLVTTYVRQSVKLTKCGYACSDHASWTSVGVPAGAATETRFEDMNTSLHTTGDKMDKLSLLHMTDYLKLAVSFVVEAARPVKG